METAASAPSGGGEPGGRAQPVQGAREKDVTRLRTSVGPAAARARKLLHDASLALTLEKFFRTSADEIMRQYLFVWFEVSHIADRQLLRMTKLQPPEMPEDSLSYRPSAQLMLSSGMTLSYLSHVSESRMGQLTQEALLVRELADLEAALGYQANIESANRAERLREADQDASVRESILCEELSKSEASASVSFQLQAVLQDMDAHRTTVTRLVLQSGLETDTMLSLLQAEVRDSTLLSPWATL